MLTLSQILLNDVILRLRKLAEDHMHGRRENLSLLAFVVRHSDCVSPQRMRQAETLAAAFQQLCVNLKTLRDRSVAHDDLNSATGKEPLPAIPKEQIDEGIRQVQEVIRLLDPSDPDAEFKYDDVIAHGDGNSLLYALMAAEELNRVRLEGGQGPWRPTSQ